MVSMQMSTDEAKKEYGEPAAADLPRYPYGLELRLDEDMLAKLGMSLPEIGAVVSISAIAKVTSISMNDREGSEPCTCVELQITDMDKPAVAPTLGDDARIARMYRS